MADYYREEREAARKREQLALGLEPTMRYMLMALRRCPLEASMVRGSIKAAIMICAGTAQTGVCEIEPDKADKDVEMAMHAQARRLLGSVPKSGG